LVDALAARAGLDGTQRVLDIGCGTDQITIPLARHARAVVAIDPVADMLARGQQAAQAARSSSLRPGLSCENERHESASRRKCNGTSGHHLHHSPR
jgi:2-polyprenyl-3-methyl-5-hydroxy-6-metoxy-1,4-benzoquinol methylase